MAGIDPEDDASRALRTLFGAPRTHPRLGETALGELARVAFEVATMPEGRAAGLSVEVWPERGVLLGARDEHELHLLVELRDDVAWVRWEHFSPRKGSDRPTDAERAGELRFVNDDELRMVMMRWLALRTSG